MNKLEATESVKGTARTVTSEDAKDAVNSNYMNYETFKRALIRLSIIGCEYLGGQDAEGIRKLEDLNRKREQDFIKRKEVASKKVDKKQ